MTTLHTNFNVKRIQQMIFCRIEEWLKSILYTKYKKFMEIWIFKKMAFLRNFSNSHKTNGLLQKNKRAFWKALFNSTKYY